MPSYAFGLDKYIDSSQGNLGVADINTGTGGSFGVVPSTVFYLGSFSWYIENDLFFYAADYPNPLVKRFPKFQIIGEIPDGTKIFGCYYVDNPNIPSGTPPLPLWADNISFYIFTGDFNGEVTEDNPTGCRIGAFNQIRDFNTLKTITDGVESRSYSFADNLYIFFATMDGGNTLYVCGNPKLTRIESVSVGVPTIIEERTECIKLEALNNDDDFIFSQLGVLDALGNAIEIDDLPSEVSTSTVGGGSGAFSLSSDNILLPSLPSLGACNSGLVTMYNPTMQQLRQLSDWLWSGSLLDTLEKMIAQPMDLIIALNLIPLTPSSLGNLQEVKIGGVGTNVNMIKVLNQYASFDCGTINLKEFYGSALDYGQYTKVAIYLPFCNIVHLKTDEVMNALINVTYHVDLFTGTCIAFITIKREGLNSILYSYEGNMSINVPLVSRDFSSIYQTVAKSAVGMLSSGMSLGGVLDSAISVMSSKPTINRSAGSSSTGGLLGYKNPYLIIERPIQSLASGYNKFVGYPSNITTTLNTLKGFTQIEEVIANGLTCTDEEQQEIISLLKEGVIL